LVLLEAKHILEKGFDLALSFAVAYHEFDNEDDLRKTVLKDERVLEGVDQASRGVVLTAANMFTEDSLILAAQLGCRSWFFISIFNSVGL
jgi:hypothetical protein